MVPLERPCHAIQGTLLYDAELYPLQSGQAWPSSVAVRLGVEQRALVFGALWPGMAARSVAEVSAPGLWQVLGRYLGPTVRSNDFSRKRPLKRLLQTRS